MVASRKTLIGYCLTNLFVFKMLPCKDIKWLAITSFSIDSCKFLFGISMKSYQHHTMQITLK